MTPRDAGRVVIVGGGLAGYSAADALRELGHPASITIIDREPMLYDRPPLSKDFLTGRIGREGLAFSSETRLAERAITVVSGTEAVDLDVAGARPAVVLSDGTVLEADTVLLATGGRARRLSLPGAEDHRVLVLRTLADAEALRDAARPGARVLIVGAGLIGAEIASALRELGAQVTLVDPVEVPLVPAVGETVAALLHGMHSDRGIRVVHGGIDAVTPGDVLTVQLSNGERIDVDLMLVGVGIEPNTELAAGAGLDVDNGVLIDSHHRTSSPGVYAAGDSARHRDPDGTLRRREEHWEAAQLGGRAAAAAMLGLEPSAPGAPWFWTDRHGAHLEAVGRLTGPGETVIRPGGPAGIPTVFLVDDGLLVGAVTVDDSMTVRAARRLIDQRIPVSADELADPSVSVRGMLRATR